MAREDLFPGAVLYGLMASVLVQLWSLAVGVTLWLRADARVSPGR